MTNNLDADEILANAPPPWQTAGPAAHRRVFNVTELRDARDAADVRAVAAEKRATAAERRAEFFANLHADESARCDRLADMRDQWQMFALETLATLEETRLERDLLATTVDALVEEFVPAFGGGEEVVR